MNNVNDAEVGATVYLRAHTKQAPAECYRGLAAVLVDAATDWPMVVVRIFDNVDQPRGREIKVHRDNVGLRRRTVKRDKDGDMTRDGGGEERAGMVGKPLGKPVPQVDPADGEQGVLF